MTVIHDNQGNAVSEFVEVSGKRVIPVYVKKSDVNDSGSPLYAYYDDDNYDKLFMDKKTNHLAIVNHNEKAIHYGVFFYIEGYIELDSGDDYYVKLVTPDSDTWPHFQWIITSSGITSTWKYEGASGGMSGGTSVSPINANRNSSNTSVMTITKDVSAPTSTGTTISTAKMGSSSGGWFSVVNGGSVDSQNEIILKQNTTYCRKFTSGSNGNVIYFKAMWGEGVFVR